MAILARLKKLSVLNLSKNKISARSLDHLAHLNSLQDLDLSENKLTLRALKKLKRLPDLHRLIVDIDDDTLNSRDMASLKGVLKNCLVITGADTQALDNRD